MYYNTDTTFGNAGKPVAKYHVKVLLRCCFLEKGRPSTAYLAEPD